MKALILAAGYATRLYPLTKDYPKPLLLIKERPIIDYLIDKLARLEAVDEIIVVTNSRFIGLFRKWKRNLKCPKKITLVDDLTSTKEDRRGAIGDMDFVIGAKRIKDDFLVLGGDNIFDADVNGFLSFAKNKDPYPVLGVFDLKDKKMASHYGVIKLNKLKRVVDFTEKPMHPQSSLIAMCLYYFPRSKLCRVQEYMTARREQHDAMGLYIDWLSKADIVYGFVFNGMWYDIGHHKVLQEAKQKFLE